MPGALDANGVWQYAEDDQLASPNWSAYMNKLAASTSTALNGPLAVVKKLTEVRSWRSVGTVDNVIASLANTATSVCPAVITITNAPAGTYQLTGTALGYTTTTVAAATTQFRVNGSTVFEPRNDLPVAVSFCQTHVWTIEHTGGTLTLDYRMLTTSANAVFQVNGSGLVVQRVL
jgi:hypothetical protein